jgi:glycosyltransferase involved in cell wall biosynthesis
MKISFAITTKNEGQYIQDVLTQLIPHCEETGDEIVVLDDFSTDDFTLSILHGYEEAGSIRLYQRELGRDFAAHKNHLAELCAGDFIFQVDADETLHPNLLKYLHDIVDNNPEIDLYHIPRVNVVNGLTQNDINKWGWSVNEMGWVMFPDYQDRLFRNHVDIKWVGKVHEKITGHKTHAPLPAEEEWALYHIKDIDRQRRQNDFYSTIGG